MASDDLVVRRVQGVVGRKAVEAVDQILDLSLDADRIEERLARLATKNG